MSNLIDHCSLSIQSQEHCRWYTSSFPRGVHRSPLEEHRQQTLASLPMYHVLCLESSHRYSFGMNCIKIVCLLRIYDKKTHRSIYYLYYILQQTNPTAKLEALDPKLVCSSSNMVTHRNSTKSFSAILNSI